MILLSLLQLSAFSNIENEKLDAIDNKFIYRNIALDINS